MILEESLAGSPLVQIVWQRLQHTVYSTHETTRTTAPEKSAGVLYCERGREVISKNTYRSLGTYQVRGLGLRYSTKERVVIIREDSFLCVIHEDKRQRGSNRSSEGVTCTCSSWENGRVWLVTQWVICKVNDGLTG